MSEQRPSVLIVADSSGESHSIQSILLDQGWDASLCENAFDALARVERDGFNLVICDVETPEIDGLELLAKIRYVAPTTRVILTNGSRSRPLDLDAAQAGATATLRKPFTASTLLSTVTRALETAPDRVAPSETLHDSTLTDALAGIIRRLRTRRYEGLKALLQDVLKGETIEFAGDLAGHLRYEEQVLFPSLAELKPEARPRLKEIEREHDRLRGYSRELAHRLGEGDGAGACGVARHFLAALLEHIERESEIVDEIVAPLGYRASVDLGRRLLLRRLRVTFRGRS
jgi:CheY-like chemotaxis protein